MSVEYSSDGSSWFTYGSTASFPNNTPDFAVMWGEVSGSATARYVRYTFTHTGWFFLSEIEILGSVISPPPPPPATVSVSVSPSSVTLTDGGTAQFIATVTGSANTQVSWSMYPQLGTLTNGLYVAPNPITVSQPVTIYAVSLADPSKWAAGTVNLSYTVAPPPSVGPMNPDSGSGSDRLFSFQAQAGSGSLQWIQVLFSNGGLTQANGCMIWYRPSDDAVAVSADNATPTQYAWAGYGVLGTNGPDIGNSQCTLGIQNSNALKQGSAITLNLSLRFSGTWSGDKQVYMSTQDSSQITAWPLVGYWNVP